MLLPWTWSWSLDLYTPNLDASKIIIMSSHEVRMSPHVIPGPWSFNTCRVFRWVVIVGLHRPGGFDIRRSCLFPEYYEVIRSLFSFFLLAVVVETSIFPQEKNPITCLLAMLEAKKFFKILLISSLFVHTQLVYIKLLNCLTWLLDGSFGDSSCWMRMYLCINAWKPITTKPCQNLLLLFGFHKKKSCPATLGNLWSFGIETSKAVSRTPRSLFTDKFGSNPNTPQLGTETKKGRWNSFKLWDMMDFHKLESF